ncbi:kinase-like domain-containing protein [Phycomyces blakesleeanus]|uniref:Kinase-like domain-containing protein n=2 Tax=Phycomyces blakesleeanus TaxID=4837 RepID=A0ABR3AZX9_PHYBL
MPPTHIQRPKLDPQPLLNTYIHNNTIRLVDIIGTGAYGVVFIGQHIHTNQRYAVKWVLGTKTTENEISIHSQLPSHQNVLSLVLVTTEPAGVFIVLEYAPGGDLFAAITKAHEIVGDNHAIRHVFLQILSAVQHCHQNGVFHRDLKPENVLLFPNLLVKLADFGLATTRTVSADFGCGSIFYYSPECQGASFRKDQKRKAYGCQQSDVWSLGVILINLVVGRNPWKEANLQDPTFKAYVRKPRHFFRSILPVISDELDSILSRIFCIDPARRISLPELRILILGCRTFTKHDTVSNTASLPPAPLPPLPMPLPLPLPLPMPIGLQQKEKLLLLKTTTATAPVAYTPSFTRTMLDYVGSYTDEDGLVSSAASVAQRAKHAKPSHIFAHPPFPAPTTRPPPLPTVTPSSWSSSGSSGSSTYSVDRPFTPESTGTAAGTAAGTGIMATTTYALHKKPTCTPFNMHSTPSLLSLSPS